MVGVSLTLWFISRVSTSSRVVVTAGCTGEEDFSDAAMSVPNATAALTIDRWLDSPKMDIFTTFFHVLIFLIITFCFYHNLI